jgi:hypothetical protein
LNYNQVPDRFLLGSRLDNFDLDSTLATRGKSSKKNQGSSKEVVSDTAGCQGSKVDLAEGNSTLDGESETVATAKVDTLLVDPGNTVMNQCASKSESSGNIELPPGPRCGEKIMTKSIEESDQQSQLPETAMSTEPYAKQTTHDLPGELVGGIDSNVDTVLDRKKDGCPQITKVNTISSGKDVNDKLLIEDGTDHEDLPFQNSSPLDIGCSGSNNGDRSMSDSAILTENDEVAKGDLDIGETSAKLVLCKTPHDFKSITGNENSTVKLPLFTQARLEKSVNNLYQLLPFVF